MVGGDLFLLSCVGWMCVVGFNTDCVDCCHVMTLFAVFAFASHTHTQQTRSKRKKEKDNDQTTLTNTHTHTHRETCLRHLKHKKTHTLTRSLTHSLTHTFLPCLDREEESGMDGGRKRERQVEEE